MSLAQHQAASTVKKTHKQLFFGDKILDLESDFWKSGYVPVLRSLIRLLRARLVQINTEMAEKYSISALRGKLAWKYHAVKYQIFAQNHTQLYSPSKAATIKNKQNKEKEAK